MRWRFTLNPDTDNLEVATPIGWHDVQFELKRDLDWHGIFFEHSLPLEFYDDPQDPAKNAYTFLTTEYDTNGIEGYVILKVELACNDTDDFTEEAQWRMDFSGYKEVQAPTCTVSLRLEPENCLMTLKNRYDQEVDLLTTETFEGSALSSYSKLGGNITYPSVTLLQIATLSSPEGGQAQVFQNVTQTDTVTSGGGGQYEDFIWYAQFGLVPGQGVSSSPPNNLDEITTRNPMTNLLMTDFADMDSVYVFEYGGEYEFHINLQGRVEVTLDSDGAKNTDCSDFEDTFTEYDLQVILLIGGTSTVLYSASGSACYTGGLVITSIPGIADYTYTQTISAGDEMKLYIRMETSGTFDKLVGSSDMLWTGKLTGQADVDIYAKTESEPSAHKSFLINEAGSRILEAVTDDCLRLLSNYYGRTDSEPYAAPAASDGDGSLRAITLGLFLRDYEARKQLTVSFKQFFDALAAIDNIGIGLEDDPSRAGYQVVRMEKSSYFYDDTVVLTLDAVPSVTITPMLDRHFSRFISGYNKFALEEYYGLDEFNTQHTYRTGLKSTNSTADKTCDWVASGYALEITRRSIPGSFDTLEDTKFDNDTFIICLERSGGTFIPEQAHIIAYGNLVDPFTVLNFRISPARNALRWLKNILASYRVPENDAVSKLFFESGDGNVIAKGFWTEPPIIEAGIITENQDLDQADILDGDGLPVFVPEAWRFDYPMTLAEYQAVKANPKGTVRATFGTGTTYKSFYIDSIMYRPEEGMATYSLMPRKTYEFDECCIYFLYTITDGTNNIGSVVLTGAAIENLFIFVNGSLLKYNDATAGNNEVTAWDDTTGYATISATPPAGRSVLIIHIPDMALACNPCVYHFEGQGDNTDTVTLTGFDGLDLSDIVLLYNGNLMKYNDTDSNNNEIISWDNVTTELVINGVFKTGREIRAFAFVNCSKKTI